MSTKLSFRKDSKPQEEHYHLSGVVIISKGETNMEEDLPPQSPDQTLLDVDGGDTKDQSQKSGTRKQEASHLGSSETAGHEHHRVGLQWTTPCIRSKSTPRGKITFSVCSYM